jgi:hypothetical protein
MRAKCTTKHKWFSRSVTSEMTNACPGPRTRDYIEVERHFIRNNAWALCAGPSTRSTEVGRHLIWNYACALCAGSRPGDSTEVGRHRRRDLGQSHRHGKEQKGGQGKTTSKTQTIIFRRLIISHLHLGRVCNWEHTVLYVPHNMNDNLPMAIIHTVLLLISV